MTSRSALVADSALVHVSSSPSERRVHRRLSPQQIAWLREARIKYGASVDVLDLSIGGALLETEMQLRPGSSSVLEIVGEDGETLIPFRVLRCHVASLKGDLRYRGALEFKRPFLPLTSSLVDAEAADAAAADEPVVDLSRLDRAIQRAVDRYLSWAEHRSSSIILIDGRPEPMDPVETIRIMEIICGEAGRHRTDLLSRALYELLVEMIPVLRMGKRARFQAARVESYLRNTLPLLTIRLQTGRPPIHLPSIESIFFAIGDQQSTAEALYVEFSSSLVVNRWQFSLLKCGASLINLLRRWELEEADTAAQLPDQLSSSEQPAVPFGWHKVIGRYIDGNVVKGYTQDFNATRKALHIKPSPHADAKTQKIIPVSRLKAVFFVREFEGDAGYSDKREFTGPLTGRRIEVSFADGEVILGSTLTYRPEREGHGFFIKPADTQSNNIRIFVVMDAVKHVRFP